MEAALYFGSSFNANINWDSARRSIVPKPVLKNKLLVNCASLPLLVAKFEAVAYYQCVLFNRDDPSSQNKFFDVGIF